MFGPLTSATVSGKLLGLDRARQRHAWGIAASQAGGITGNFGTHTKPLHGGIASQAGVMAAELAADGFEANPDALDAPLGYVYSVVAAGRMEGVDVGKATAGLGQWHIADTWRLKKYPCGYIAQGAIDAALRFREESRLGLDDLTSVEIRVPHLQPYFRVRPDGRVFRQVRLRVPGRLRDPRWGSRQENILRRGVQAAGTQAQPRQVQDSSRIRLPRSTVRSAC